MNCEQTIDVKSLFNQHLKKNQSSADCLAQISVKYNISPDLIKSSGIEYCDRFFRKRLASILSGDSDCKSVFFYKCVCIFIYIYIY
jgi:hypothetical protein